MASAKVQTLARFKNLGLSDLVWLPDGRGLLATYQSKISPIARNQVGFISKPAGQFRTITKDTNNYQTLTLSADGKTLATVQQKLTRTLYLLPAEGFAGSPPNPALAQNKDSFLFGWASNGDLYFDDGGNLLRISPDGSNKTTLLSDPAAEILRATGCRGARYVLFTWAGHGAENKVNIWRIDADGSNPKQLTDGTLDIAPECSSDGEWVYYQEVIANRIKRVPIDGGTPEVVPGTVIPGTLIGAPGGYDISRDGKRLAFVEGNAEKGLDLWTLPLDTSDPEHPKAGKPELFLRSASWVVGPSFSPDGRWISYASTESGRSEVFVRPFPAGGPSGSGKWLISTGGGQFPIWSHDGRELFYEGLDNRIMAAAYTAKGDSFAAEKPRPWSNTQLFLSSDVRLNLDVAPDGRRFVVTQRADSTGEPKGSVHVTFLLNFFDEVRRRVSAGR